MIQGPSLLKRLLLGQFAILIAFASFAAVNFIWQFYREQGPLNGALSRYANKLGPVVDRLQSEQADPKVLTNFVSTYGELIQDDLSIEKTGKPAAQSGLNIIIAISLAENGKELVRSANTAAEIRLPKPELGIQQVQIASKSWHIATVLSPNGKHYIQFAEPQDIAFAGVRLVLLEYIVYPLTIFLPMSALLMGLVIHFGLKPINSLTKTIEQRDPNNLTPFSVERLDAETKPLIKAINALMVKLRRTLELERGFLADAAHELRTPLAVIQAQSHLLETAANQSEREKAARKLEHGVARAASLIEKLLAGAQMNSEDFKPQFEQLSVNNLVQERVAALSILAVKKQIELSFHQTEVLEAVVSKSLFVSAFDNVLDNAIRYTPEFGTITVSVSRYGIHAIEIAVVDSGIGIQPEEQEKVFERFHRVIGREQNGHQAVGSGLGLSIVKQAINTHGGTVHLQTGPANTGLLVQLRIPLKQ
jgi:two-component system, OmpR family, sensor histidine kinase QseC